MASSRCSVRAEWGAVYKGGSISPEPAGSPIKAIREHWEGDKSRRARLRAEALAAASLDHPYICKVYELIEEQDRTLIIMEFVEGVPLSSLLRRGALPP